MMTNMTITKQSNATPQSGDARFWDRLARRYSEKPVPDEAVYEQKLALTQSLLEPHMHILELGCGTGTTALKHAPFVERVVATDISAGMLDIARDKAADQNVTNVHFEQSAVEDLQVPEQSQDVVLALSLLHLLEDKERVLEQIHHMLKPGGHFVSSTACLGDKMGFFRYIGPLGAFLGLIPRVQVFSVAQLKQSLASAGFELEHEWLPPKSQSVFLIARKA